MKINTNNVNILRQHWCCLFLKIRIAAYVSTLQNVLAFPLVHSLVTEDNKLTGKSASDTTLDSS